MYTLANKPELLWSYDTCDNDQGVVAVNASPTRPMLAIPGRQAGHIQLIELRPSRDVKQPNPASIVQAHTSALACLALSSDGRRLASASIKGTLVRIFDTLNGQLIAELRRGSDQAWIWSLAFNGDASRLAVASDKGTVHIFNVFQHIRPLLTEKEPMQEWTSIDPDLADIESMPTSIYSTSAPQRIQQLSQHVVERFMKQASPRHPSSLNRQSSLSFMKALLPKYFSSEWSFAYARLLSPECRCVCAFGADDCSILVLTDDGCYYKFLLNKDLGGECLRIAFHRFLEDL